MRSELVAQAVAPVPNRFLLVHVATAITRKFHRRTKDRLPETINNSLAGLGEGNYVVWPTGVVSLGGRALVETQLEQGMALIVLTTLATGIPYFPPESAPAKDALTAEIA